MNDELFNEFLMAAGHDDMVIANRIGQVEGAVALLSQFGQKSPEDALRAAGTYVDQAESMRPVVAIVTAPEVILEGETSQEFLLSAAHCLLVVQFGGERVDGYCLVHATKIINIIQTAK